MTRSVDHVPLFANTPLGKALLQYNLASHQRVLMRGMQEGRAHFTSMMVGMTSVGLLSAWLCAYTPQCGQCVRRIGVEPVGKLLGPTASLISDVSKAAGALIGAATGDAITDSQPEAVKRLVPFQCYVGMRQALDLLTADE